MSDRPNVLLVQADQHRFDCVGANGHERLETPALDSLAVEGTNFTNAYTPTPICSPERASLLCGQWPSRHGTRNLVGQPGGRPFDPDLRTFSGVLSKAGYNTRYVGRWHLGHTESGGPETFGFDEWVPNDRYTTWRKERGLPERAGPNPETGWFGGSDPVDAGDSRLGWAADRTIDRLEELAAADDPFLLRWDTFEPHPPNVVSEPYASLYDPADIEPWGSFPDDLEDKPDQQERVRRAWRLEGLGWEDWAPLVARYLGEISHLDHHLGRVLDRLEGLGLAEDTLVIYTADHGDMCGSHGMIDKHFNMYDDVMHVPLLVRGPDVPAGEERTDFVTNALDVAATITDAAGEGIPDPFQGRSLLRGFENPETHREDIYGVYYGCQMGLYTSRMVRTDRWKYVWNLTAPDELYDLESDSHELDNRAVDPDSVAVTALSDLRERTVEWAEATDDDLRNPWALGQLREEEWVWPSPGEGPI